MLHATILIIPLRSSPHFHSKISYDVLIIFMILPISSLPTQLWIFFVLPPSSPVCVTITLRNGAFPGLSSPTRGHIVDERWLSFLQKLSNAKSSLASGRILCPHTCLYAKLCLVWASASLVHVVIIAVNLYVTPSAVSREYCLLEGIPLSGS